MMRDRAGPRLAACLMVFAFAVVIAVASYSVSWSTRYQTDIRQTNALWAAMQVEVELARFRASVVELKANATPEAIKSVHEVFDILWSRAFVEAEPMTSVMRSYDTDGTIEKIKDYLKFIKPTLEATEQSDIDALSKIVAQVRDFEKEARAYTLRGIRGESNAMAAQRIETKKVFKVAVVIGWSMALVAVVSLLVAFFLLLRSNGIQIESLTRRAR